MKKIVTVTLVLILSVVNLLFSEILTSPYIITKKGFDGSWLNFEKPGWYTFGVLTGGRVVISDKSVAWMWDNQNKLWKVYSPNQKIQELVKKYNIPTFKTVGNYQGLFVYTKGHTAIGIHEVNSDKGVRIYIDPENWNLYGHISPGWNLIGSTIFNFKYINTLSDFVTLWQWNHDTGWKVASPVPKIQKILKSYGLYNDGTSPLVDALFVNYRPELYCTIPQTLNDKQEAFYKFIKFLANTQPQVYLKQVDLKYILCANLEKVKDMSWNQLDQFLHKTFDNVINEEHSEFKTEFVKNRISHTCYYPDLVSQYVDVQDGSFMKRLKKYNIAYLRIASFNKIPGSVFDNIQNLKGQVNGLIIDLRGNKGGNMGEMTSTLLALLNSSISNYLSYSGLYMKNYKMVCKYSTALYPPSYKDKAQTLIKSYWKYIVILVDSSTCSSAETFAMHLRMLGGKDFVQVVGERTGDWTGIKGWQPIDCSVWTYSGSGGPGEQPFSFGALTYNFALNYPMARVDSDNGTTFRYILVNNGAYVDYIFPDGTVENANEDVMFKKALELIKDKIGLQELQSSLNLDLDLSKHLQEYLAKPPMMDFFDNMSSYLN